MKRAWFFLQVLAACSALVATIVGIAALSARGTVAALDEQAQRVEVKATFDAPDQAIVEFPAVVRGRIVRCVVYANTKRRASAVMC